MTHSNELDALFTAMSKAQVDISDPKKNATNPAFRNRYADIGQVWDVVKPILAAHQLVLFLLPSQGEPGQVAMDYMIGHWPSGQYITGRTAAQLTKQDLQGFGGGLTYLTRYINTALFGLAAEDDDGNTASGKTTSPSTKKEEKSAAPDLASKISAIQTKRKKLGLGDWSAPADFTEEQAKKEWEFLKELEKSGEVVA